MEFRPGMAWKYPEEDSKNAVESRKSYQSCAVTTPEFRE